MAMTNNSKHEAILLLGATGSGKSSFVSSLGLPAKIGHGLHSCTASPQGWKYINTRESPVMVIDTPGFNDTNRSDMDLLEMIIGFIIAAELQVVGIIYIQPINTRRLTGSCRTNLKLLRAIAGEDFYPNVTLVTSMWSMLAEDEWEHATSREGDFLESSSVWKPLRKKGAAYFRWDEHQEACDTACASDILNTYQSKQPVPALNILIELNQHLPLEETSAGRILTAEILKQQERERRELLAEQEELEALQHQVSELKSIAAQAGSKNHQHDKLSGHFSTDSDHTIGLAVRSRARTRAQPFERELLERQSSPPSRSGDSRRTLRRKSRDLNDFNLVQGDKTNVLTYGELVDDVKRQRARKRWEKLARHLGFRGKPNVVIIERRVR